MKIKRAKHKSAHTDPKLMGMGDNYGSGVKNKIGKLRDSFTPQMKQAPKYKTKIPPKTLA